MAIGIVTGLRAEARIAERLRDVRVISGAQPEAAARRLIGEGVRGLLSFGIAGGLSPDLHAGAMLIATAVIDHGQRFEAAEAWRSALLARLPEARAAPILGSERAVATAAEKAHLYHQTGALAVDMESRAVARAATDAGIPFAALRVIADGAAETLPLSARDALTDEGAVALGKVFLGLLRRPRELPMLLRLGRETRIAFRALGAAGNVLATRGLGLS